MAKARKAQPVGAIPASRRAFNSEQMMSDEHSDFLRREADDSQRCADKFPGTSHGNILAGKAIKFIAAADHIDAQAAEIAALRAQLTYRVLTAQDDAGFMGIKQMSFETDTIGDFPIVSHNCLGCGQPLTVENAWMTDGCPCNTSLGVNSMNETRWRLLMELQQRQSHDLDKLRTAVRSLLSLVDLRGSGDRCVQAGGQ